MLWRYWSLNTKMFKKLHFQCFGTNFYHQWAPNPKVVGTIETSSSVCFFWHLAKSNLMNSYGDIGV